MLDNQRLNLKRPEKQESEKLGRDQPCAPTGEEIFALLHGEN